MVENQAEQVGPEITIGVRGAVVSRMEGGTVREAGRFSWAPSPLAKRKIGDIRGFIKTTMSVGKGNDS